MDEQLLGLFDFSVGSLVGSFVFGVIGFYLFREGKKRLNFRVLWIGVALMTYPLFVSGTMWVWGVGLALSGLAYFSLSQT